MDKKEILNSIDDLTAEQLADFIKQGIVTFQELKDTGELDASKRSAIVKILKKKDAEDDAAWEAVRDSSEDVLREWIRNNPNNRNIQAAEKRVDFLETDRIGKARIKRRILDNIRRNPNSHSPDNIRTFLGNGTICEQDLLDCDIPQSAIDNLDNIKTPQLQLGNTPTSIPEGYTEVYFWGGTGSGKTCALGAILQMAEKKGLLNIATGPGYLYANQLKNIFSDDDRANDYLPAPSPVETTQYLPFTLNNPKEKGSRSVSLIELSGEIFKCFFHKNAGQKLPTQSHENTFNSLNVFLSSKNRKIHFFFIDYDRENCPDSFGLKQSDYLAAASTYFRNNKVFGNTTDAIYVVLTKSDLLLDENGDKISSYDKRVEHAIKHLGEQSYQSFINTLKENCKKYSINGGKLTVEPFSLGAVYFKQICNFEGSAATKIVDILMERIPLTKTSFLDKFNQ
jgi:hypothetical protein